MMIYPEWVNGDRIAHCSDEAQMHFPRLAAIANGFGRMQLNYSEIIEKAYKSIRSRPSRTSLMGWIAEYRKHYLILTYKAEDGTPWAEWCGVPKNALPRFKRAADIASPEPPKEAMEAYLNARKAEQRKSAEENGDLMDFSDDFGNVQKTSEGFGTLQQGEGEGEVVVEGVVEGEGEGERQKHIHVIPSFAEECIRAWNENCGALPKVEKLTESLTKSINRRRREKMTVEDVTQAADLAKRTPFTRGEGKPRDGKNPWRATFRWLMENDANLGKVLDGSYGEPDPLPIFWRDASAEEFWGDAMPADAIVGVSASA